MLGQRWDLHSSATRMPPSKPSCIIFSYAGLTAVWFSYWMVIIPLNVNFIIKIQICILAWLSLIQVAYTLLFKYFMWNTDSPIAFINLLCLEKSFQAHLKPLQWPLKWRDELCHLFWGSCCCEKQSWRVHEAEKKQVKARLCPCSKEWLPRDHV